MTREEAIKILSNHEMIDVMWDKADEALNMAIDALEQEPCEDCISRQIISDYVGSHIQEINTGYGDLNKHTNEILRMIVDYIESIPPVTPQPKTGHWIEKDGFDGDTYYNCSECGESWTTIEGTPWSNGMKFCPNCGAKMLPTDLQFGDQDTLMSAT